jgi:hypothetical protein
MAEDVVHPTTGEVIAERNQDISDELAKKLAKPVSKKYSCDRL